MSRAAGAAVYPTFDFGSALNASNLNMRHYSGGIEIQNMGAGTGTYNMSLEGNGQLVINANCSATSNVAIRGNFDLTNNASGISITETARYDIGEITATYPTRFSSLAINTAGQVTVDTIAGTINANVVQISGDSTAADNLELDYDGTGYAKANSTIGTCTTLTGHTAQTGDTFAQLPTRFSSLAINTAGQVQASSIVITDAQENSIADALLDRANAIESGITLRTGIRYIAAATAGELSGAATTTATIKAINNSGTTRISCTVDADGNRSAFTYS